MDGGGSGSAEAKDKGGKAASASAKSRRRRRDRKEMTLVASMDTEHCKGCDKRLDNTDDHKSTKRIDDRLWHRSCVRCTDCERQLGDDFTLAAGSLPRCYVCTAKARVAIDCRACRTAIERRWQYKYTDGNGHYWHPECYRCDGCAGRMHSGTCLYAASGLWHQACLLCARCADRLYAPTHSVYKGKPVCAGCFRRLFWPICGRCRKPIMDTEALGALNGYWHAECFRCHRCQRRIKEDAYSEEKHGQRVAAVCVRCRPTSSRRAEPKADGTRPSDR